MYFLPLELVREIITKIFDESTLSATCEEPGRRKKPTWSSVEALTVASKAYRALVLERWFRTLFIKSEEDLSVAQDLLPEIKWNWARELHCVHLVSSSTQAWELHGFERLAKIRLDWLSPTMTPLRLHGSEDPADRLPFTRVPSTVTELDIRGLPWPSPLIFHNIGRILAGLEVLRLRQQRIWCGLCHTCSVARFRAPGPEKIVYEGGLGLPMHYARAFGSLSRLHTVCITIPDFGSGQTTVFDGKGQNQYLWAGECDRCMGIMYKDHTFRDRWLERKRGVHPDGKAIFYVCPPALRRVEWRFWKAEGDEDPDDLESENEFPGSGDE